MPFFEILKAGKVIKRVEVPRAKALAGCSIRVGTAGNAVLKLGESTRVGEYDVRLVEGSAVGESGGPIPTGPTPRLEGYAIQNQLGEGGMGTVWKGIQLSTKRAVAIKFLSARAFESERAQRRFVREVELSAKLEHPNIARIYDSGLRHGAYYYAMELVQGVSLDKYVEEKKLDHAQILAIMRTVCQAIEHAHQRGVVHRDLKPTNIMVDTTGQPRVVDFGLAKSLQVDDTEKQMTVSIEGNAAGTPAYMSPEQAIGRIEEIDGRTDIYSIGVILYRLLVGQPPIDLSGSRFEVMQRIVRNEIRAPRQFNKAINADLEGLLRKCLAAAPEDRYASAGELADDIENYTLGRPLRARKATAIYLLGKRLGRHRLAVAAAVAGCMTLALIMVGLLPNGWLRQWLSVTRVVRVQSAAIVKEVMVPSTQPTTAPVAHGKLEDAVPYQSQAGVLWDKVKDLDRGQGLGEKLDAATAVILSAQTFYDKGVYDSAADSYKQFIKQCGEIQSFADARQKAAAARDSWQKSADAAKQAGMDTADADVWKQAQSTAGQASDQFEAGDFTAALSAWETAADTIEKQKAKQAIALATAATQPATQPEATKPEAPFVAGKFDYALQFNGTTDHAEINDPVDHHLDMGPNATLETWVRFDNVPADGDFATFISKDEGASGHNKWIFGYASNYSGVKNCMILFLGYGEVQHPAVLLLSDPWVPAPGQWYHVAVSKTGNNYIFYRDGAVCGHASAANPAPSVNHSVLLGEAESGFRFCGAMDDVQFWNISRASKEIQADMNHELTGSEPGLVAYWPLNEGAGTTLHNLSRSEDVALFYGTHGLTSTTQPTQQFDLNKGLVLHFSLDKAPVNGMVRDESGNGNDGKVQGTKWISDGPPGSGGSFVFSAANKTDAVIVPDSPSLDVGQFTECAWIKTSFADQWWRRILQKGFNGSYALYLAGDPLRIGQPDIRGEASMELNTGQFHTFASPQFCNDNKWHFIVGTFNGSRARIYVDGSIAGAHDLSGTTNVNASPLIVGNDVTSAGRTENGMPGTLAFDGKIADVRIYNRPLSPDEIVALRDTGFISAAATAAARQVNVDKGLVLHFSLNKPPVDIVAKDESGNGNDGKVIGAKWTADGPGGRGGAYSFTAANKTDAIVVADSPSLNPAQITEAAWIKTGTSDKWWRRIIHKDFHDGYVLSTSGGPVTSSDGQTRGKAEMQFGVGSGAVHSLYSDRFCADGRWHLLVGTFDGAQAKLYVDGQVTNDSQPWSGKITANTSPLIIGNAAADAGRTENGVPGSSAFDGEISEVRIYNRALSAEEVVAMRDSVVHSNAGPETSPQVDLNNGLVLHFSFATSAGAGIVRDESGNGNDGQVIGTKWVADGPGEGAYLFNMANRTDVIFVADSQSLNPEKITESAWVKTRTTDKWWHRIIDKEYRSAYDLAEGGDLNNGSTAWRGKAIMNVGYGDDHRSYSDEPIADGKWHHLASTYDGNKALFYVDGKEQKNQRVWVGRIAGNSNPLRIGNGAPKPLPDGTPDIFAFDGEISDVRIYNRALSADEISAVRDAGYVSLVTAQAAEGAKTELLAAQANQPNYFENFDSNGSHFAWTRNGEIWIQVAPDSGGKRQFKIAERSMIANHKGTTIQAADGSNFFVFIPDRNSGSPSVLSRTGDGPWLEQGTMQNAK